MKNFELSFSFLTGTASLGTAITVSCDKTVTVTLAYDFRDRPLTLTADANPGDAVSLTVRPHRIELRVNGALLDEEWPCGRLDVTPDTPVSGGFPMTVTEIAPECPADLPFVTRAGIRTADIRLPGVKEFVDHLDI